MSADTDFPSPSEAEAGAEQARAGLVSTLNQLRENLKPANVMDEVMTNAKVSASVVSDQIWSTARRNPLPALMIGAGLAMLLGVGARAATPARRVQVTGRNPPDPRNALAIGSRLGSRRPALATSTSPANSVRRTAGTVQTQAADLMGQASSRISDAASRGASAISNAFKGQSTTGGDTMSYYPHTTDHVRTSFARILDDQPLVLAAIGIAVGAALGAAIPQTETENSLLGETSHQVRDAATGLVQDQVSQLRSAATHAVDEIKQSVADHGVNADNLSGLVKDVGEKAKSAAQEAGKSLDAKA